MVCCLVSQPVYSTESNPAPSPKPEIPVNQLNIIWGEWAPADYLQQICNLYESQTGIKVNVITKPWSTYSHDFLAAMETHSTDWDMVIGDSQWLGLCTTQGYYENLTQFLINEGIAPTVTEASLARYSEYPALSGQYWAFPTEGDAMGWAYRKDLFDNESEKAAFQNQYGYPLGVPTTFVQLRDVANFFTRPESDLYGVALFTQKDYDAMTMGFENMLFSWGTQWQNPATNEVMGIINSPKAVEACQFYRDLYSSCQAPDLDNAANAETNQAFITGKAAMCMNYFGFFSDLTDTVINPYAEVTGFFANPEGPYRDRHSALGGQGISIISFISAERKQAAKDFIRWFAGEEVQSDWAEIGGLSCNKNVLNSDIFLQAAPYNPAFAQSMEIVMDFWNIPEYQLMLDITQNELHRFIVEGIGSSQAAMDTIANLHNRILEEYGYLAHVEEFPTAFYLSQNYPNPFTDETSIRYKLPGSCFVRISIQTLFGQEVAILVNQIQEAGSYEVKWNAVNLAAGFYLNRMEITGANTGMNATVRKILLVR